MYCWQSVPWGNTPPPTGQCGAGVSQGTTCRGAGSRSSGGRETAWATKNTSRGSTGSSILVPGCRYPVRLVCSTRFPVKLTHFPTGFRFCAKKSWEQLHRKEMFAVLLWDVICVAVVGGLQIPLEIRAELVAGSYSQVKAGRCRVGQ